jgi:BioD-like phosphotransacetylase family protein
LSDQQIEVVKDMLAGVVVNFVPSGQVDALKNELKALSESLNIPLVGLLPEEPALLGMELNELVTTLEGTYMTAPERADEMVEKVAVIPVSIDVSPPFFESHHHTALITRGDRPDLQLSALNEPGLCLVLTNAKGINPSVLYRAEELNRPVVASPFDTATSLDRVNKTFADTRFSQESKMAVLIESMSEHLDTGSLSSNLGLSA